MKLEIVQKYLEEILGNRLKELKIQDEYIQKIKENIQNQMYSILYHWNDQDFRKSILVVGMEQGIYYEQEAEIDIKNFVVVAIRNSYIEDIFCDECKTMGLDKPIDEKYVKIITGEAIEYFKNINFSEVSKMINNNKIVDVYQNIIKDFPLAWEALIQLGACNSKKVIYNAKTKPEKSITNELHKMHKNLESLADKNLKETKSGISEEFSPELINLLENIIKNKNNILYVDSFKMLTRNFRKLLFVIEILLENECGLLTSNYLIKKSYIGKRTEILRAAHTIKEVTKKMESKEFTCGLSKTHKDILKAYMHLSGII